MSESNPELAPDDPLVEARRREAELLRAQMVDEQIAANDPEKAAAAAEKERLRMVDAVTGLAIGRIVEYRSRTGNYSVPAMVNCTTDSIYQPGVEAGHVPALQTTDRVHLTVFTPGRPGMRGEADNFVVAPDEEVSENLNGCYQEWNIPYDPDGGPGTWKWPTRV
jgi:hypothetical protein